MILLIDLCCREDSLGFEEFVLPPARFIEGCDRDTEIVHFRSVPGSAALARAEGVILCGAPLADNAFHDQIRSFQWLAQAGVPLLGICAGMEVICSVFGGRLGPCTEIGMTGIRITRPDPLFPAVDPFMAYELHSWACTEPGPLQVLAVSERCIQVVRHPERPVYGVMFHPEVRNEWVLERFLGFTR